MKSLDPYLLSPDFIGPDLGLNCMQNLPAVKTFEDNALKHSMNLCFCTGIYDIETVLVKKKLFKEI